MSAILELAQETATSAANRQEWMAKGRELAASDSHLRFEIGDWLAEGGKWNRELYDDAAAIFTNYTRRTLANLRNVAYSVETSFRNDALSWSHHKAVARLAPEAQKKMLGRAAEEGLSVSALRRLVDEEFPDDDTGSSDEPKFIKRTLTVPLNLDAELKRAAQERGDEVEATILFLARVALNLPDIWQKLRDPEAE